MVIKSYALELRGYEESRIVVLTYTHIHTVGERSHITSSFIFDFLVTLRLIIRA